MIHHGDRLRELIDDRYSNVDSALIFLNNAGLDISRSALYRLMNGQWPSEKQVEIICKHFDIAPQCLLFGECHNSLKHAKLMSILSPQMRDMLTKLNEAVAEAAADYLKNNPDWRPGNNQPPPTPPISDGAN